nr:MAG TPA: hypothetical protein [Caudoviricetes sp.]
MRNYKEFKDYLKQRTDTSNNDFRRRCLVECLDDYMDELLDRRNIHESDSEEYRKLEKRRVELSKRGKATGEAIQNALTERGKTWKLRRKKS